MTRVGRMRTTGAVGRAGLLMSVLLVLGVAWMHTLAAAPLPGGGHTGAMMAAVAMPACSAGGHDAPCPDTSHGGGHATAMCQSTPSGAIGVLKPELTPSLLTASAAVSQPLPATVAVDAAGGSGCGSPSLTMLSISRT